MCFLKVQESLPKVGPEGPTGRRPPGVQRQRAGGHPVWGRQGVGQGCSGQTTPSGPAGLLDPGQGTRVKAAALRRTGRWDRRV